MRSTRVVQGFAPLAPTCQGQHRHPADCSRTATWPGQKLAIPERAGTESRSRASASLTQVDPVWDDLDAVALGQSAAEQAPVGTGPLGDGQAKQVCRGGTTNAPGFARGEVRRPKFVGQTTKLPQNFTIRNRAWQKHVFGNAVQTRQK